MKENHRNQGPGNRVGPLWTLFVSKNLVFGSPGGRGRVGGPSEQCCDFLVPQAEPGWRPATPLTFMGRQPERGKLEPWQGHKSQAVVRFGLTLGVILSESPWI